MLLSELASISTPVQPAEQGAEIDERAGNCFWSCRVQFVEFRDPSLRGAVCTTETAAAAQLVH